MANRTQSNRRKGQGNAKGRVLIRARQNSAMHENGTLAGGEDPLADLVNRMKSWGMITYYQKQISENLKGSLWFGDTMQSWFPLAPANLWQDILRNWSFSIFNITNQMRGNPELETKIVKGVAGYGSQLGTIMDFLEVLARNGSVKEIKDIDDRFKVFRFVDLLDRINTAKGRPGSESLKSKIKI